MRKDKKTSRSMGFQEIQPLQKKKQEATILTSTANKGDLEGKERERTSKNEAKERKYEERVKRNVSKDIEKTSKKSKEEIICPSCEERYLVPPVEVRMKCNVCESWWLEACTVYDNRELPIVTLAEAHRFIVDCMIQVGTPRTYAETFSDNLIEADYRGHYSHGMNRLNRYLRDVETGLCAPKATPKILSETPATAWVTGNNGLGAVIGKYCMEIAIAKAKEVGVGWVVAKETNHYGIAGMFSLQAIKEGMVGMSFTNTSPLMAPTRAKEHALGTNPLTLGAPALHGDSFVLDMATTTVSAGKIEIHRRKREAIPDTWALDSNGRPTTNADVAFNAKRLMPLGGTEENGGYKGYGLSMLVEIFCGILAGSSYGPNVRRWGDSGKMANLGQCYVAINPKCFAPGFEERLTDLLQTLRNIEPTSPERPVLVSGDPERMHMELVDKQGGLRYLPDQQSICKELARRLKVRPMKFTL